MALTDVESLLDKLASSLDSATSALPSNTNLLPPTDGISLLDTKSELFLSYLQNLVFLILLKIRNHSHAGKTNVTVNAAQSDDLMSEVVKKLVELRVYLEKGVRPLENKLKYQIDKVLRAADVQPRSATKANGGATKNGVEGDNSSSDEDEDGEEDEDDEALAYRPNPASILRDKAATTPGKSISRGNEDTATGVYRPPRINPTALPVTETANGSSRDRSARPGRRSAAMDEFISAELSTAPQAEPSIGSTILGRGRRTKSSREMADDAARTAYEEANYTRLPTLSKKERLKRGYSSSGRGESMYGGEELRGLGEGLDRIARITGPSKGRGFGDRERKRPMTVDGPRGSGSSDAPGRKFKKMRPNGKSRQ